MNQTYSPAPPPTRLTFITLTLVWLVMTLAALGFVEVFCANAPNGDEWEFVPALLGEESFLNWLWKLHNEHRLPLSRAIYYPLFQITRDFRSGMFLQVALLSALSLGMMRFAARLRGRPDWVDVFFPVSLLHLGHWENFVMGYQLCFALFCCLVSCLALVVMRTQRESLFRSGVLAGTLLLSILMTGGSGLPLVPPVAAWLVYLAVLLWRSGTRMRAFILLVVALLPAVYIAFYFNGYSRPGHHKPPSTDPITVGYVAGEVLSMALGYGIVGVWVIVALAELAIGVATVTLLVKQGRDSANRPSSIGLICVSAGIFGLALSIGMSRGSLGLEMGLWARYSLLTWPLLGSAFLVWVKAGRKFIPTVLCVATALAFPSNMMTGIQQGERNRRHYEELESDVRAGLSAEEMVHKRFPNSHNSAQADRAIQKISLLKSEGIGIFGAGKR